VRISVKISLRLRGSTQLSLLFGLDAMASFKSGEIGTNAISGAFERSSVLLFCVLGLEKIPNLSLFAWGFFFGGGGG
jgi:hypothetical protein